MYANVNEHLEAIKKIYSSIEDVKKSTVPVGENFIILDADGTGNDYYVGFLSYTNDGTGIDLENGLFLNRRIQTQGDLEQNIAEQIKEFEKLVADSIQALEDKGDEIENNIIDQGTTQVDRIDAQASQVNDNLDIMWRMYSITTGANRYLSGNNIDNRDNTKLDREVIGGDITQRSGQPRKVYFGGNIADRAIVNALNIDLGSSRG